MAKKAETKEKKTRKTKSAKVTYRDATYEVLERTQDKLKLTDGTIHFWVKAGDVQEK